MPDHLHSEASRRGVGSEGLHEDPHHSLQGMQPGSGEDPFFEAVPLENPLHGRRIRMSPEVPESRDQPPRAIRPHHLFEILAVICEGMHVMQNQATPVQMQMPFVEGDQFLQAQIGCFHECPVKG